MLANENLVISNDGTVFSLSFIVFKYFSLNFLIFWRWKIRNKREVQVLRFLFILSPITYWLPITDYTLCKWQASFLLLDFYFWTCSLHDIVKVSISNQCLSISVNTWSWGSWKLLCRLMDFSQWGGCIHCNRS